MKERKPFAPVLPGETQSTTDADGVVRGVEQYPSRPVEQYPSRPQDLSRSYSSAPPAPNAAPATRVSDPAPRRARRVKTRGRLDRAVLAMLGKGLEDCFDEVRKQEVPERFKLLLQRF